MSPRRMGEPRSREPWPCRITMQAAHWNGRVRGVSVGYEGGGDARGLGLAALRRRLRKPHLWYGCGYRIATPLGQVVEGVFEPESGT